ncbi:MAG: hypothetical protein JWO20_1448 [Candidatus Angelobacter sp.]|nr:hypothetical protein [Candidatus Angelobacter sp.]
MTATTPDKFLISAKGMNVGFVVLQVYVFDESVLEGLCPDEANSFSDDDGTSEQKSWAELSEKYEPFLQQSFAYEIHFIKDGICFSMREEAGWYKSLERDVLDYAQQIEENTTEETPTPELSDKEVQEIAMKLAEIPEFYRASNQSSRMYVFKKHFMDVVEQYSESQSLWEVITRAKQIFDFEVKPRVENEIDQQIQTLFADGLTQEKIAKQLNITPARVRKAAAGK